MQEIDVQTVVFREGEHFVAQCLDVDVSSFGANEEEALINPREAFELYSRTPLQMQSPKWKDRRSAG